MNAAQVVDSLLRYIDPMVEPRVIIGACICWVVGVASWAKMWWEERKAARRQAEWELEHGRQRHGYEQEVMEP